MWNIMFHLTGTIDQFTLQPFGDTKPVIPVRYRPLWGTEGFRGFSCPCFRRKARDWLKRRRNVIMLHGEGMLLEQQETCCSFPVDKTAASRQQRGLCQRHSRARKVEPYREAKTKQKCYKRKRKIYKAKKKKKENVRMLLFKKKRGKKEGSRTQRNYANRQQAALLPTYLWFGKKYQSFREGTGWAFYICVGWNHYLNRSQKSMDKRQTCKMTVFKASFSENKNWH